MDTITDLHELRYEFDKLAPKIRPLMLEKCGHKCAYCESDQELQIDHIVALSLGGTNNVNNLQILCKSCNTSKGGRKREKLRKIAPPYSLRISDELRNQLDKIAAKEGRTTGNLIIQVLKKWVARQK